MTIKEITQSHAFQKILWILGGCLILLFVFQAGMYVGYKRATFSSNIGENYFREMIGKNVGGFSGIAGNDFINAHGAIGQIVEIKLPLIVVADTSDNVDKVIRIATSTAIKNSAGTEQASDLNLGDFVTIFGSGPDGNSIITARLVRVLPPPKTIATSSKTNNQN